MYGHISNWSIPYSDFMHCMMNNEERVRVSFNHSLKPVLIDCVNDADFRQTFYNVNNLYDLFTNVAGDASFKF